MSVCQTRRAVGPNAGKVHRQQVIAVGGMIVFAGGAMATGIEREHDMVARLH
jgi:hypothetical protein